jgi:hypothetical protein
MKFQNFGIEWEWGGPDADQYYFMINLETKDETYYDPATNKPIRSLRWDFLRFWYDGPHCQLNLWRVVISWSMANTLPPFEFCNGYTQRKWLLKPKWVRKLWCMEPYLDPATNWPDDTQVPSPKQGSPSVSD